MSERFVFLSFFFFFNDTATTEIYTLSLHDALPISYYRGTDGKAWAVYWNGQKDRKSTRLNSSHLGISYAVFCLKKKKKYKSLHLLNKDIKTTPDQIVEKEKT